MGRNFIKARNLLDLWMISERHKKNKNKRFFSPTYVQSNNGICHFRKKERFWNEKKKLALKDYNELIHSVIWSSLLIPHSWTSDVLNWQKQP